ncbi:MAG: hypothetical protein CSA75_04070 [Sorangium cellulosum]|nr:MAG: hypothetical protein CSA75_04070 [Sorangium cellulosum]
MSKSPTERGLVLLKEPVDISEAMQVVRTFFRAVADEDMDMMRSVLANEAQALPIGNGDPKEAERFWERRFSKFDYTALGGEPMYRESMVETYRYEDLEEPLAGRPQRPATMKSNDVLIRVYVTHTRIGINRVLGSEIFFVLRRTERKFEVQALHEDFTAP